MEQSSCLRKTDATTQRTLQQLLNHLLNVDESRVHSTVNTTTTLKQQKNTTICTEVDSVANSHYDTHWLETSKMRTCLSKRAKVFKKFVHFLFCKQQQTNAYMLSTLLVLFCIHKNRLPRFNFFGAPCFCTSSFPFLKNIIYSHFIPYIRKRDRENCFLSISLLS